ncbi:DUF456 domain-containing protein [Psychroserpens jangbogonensis]|uniref:DUF456 domain-containing protein n=1 Tax=Psychroserpens jangbogonensis TaxID=1484460 RepID=UPI00053E969D|nr:DUF456 domain-containing protein [Psychroserpens jangbogonensis]
MTIVNTYTFFEKLKNETHKKSEIKIYEKFLYILSELKIREFTVDKIQSIEAKLDNLNLKSNPENRKKHYSKGLKEFEDYLREKHSLISIGYYTNIGISTGAAFGTVLGVVLGMRFEKSLGLSVGISIGMLIGLFIGRNMDSKAKATGNIL